MCTKQANCGGVLHDPGCPVGEANRERVRRSDFRRRFGTEAPASAQIHRAFADRAWQDGRVDDAFVHERLMMKARDAQA